MAGPSWLSCLQNYLTMKAVLLGTVSYFTQTKQDNKNSGEIFYQLQWESGNRCFFRDNTKYFETKTKTMKLMKILHVLTDLPLFTIFSSFKSYSILLQGVHQNCSRLLNFSAFQGDRNSILNSFQQPFSW